jgi:fructosamine-3-kinase
MFRMNDDAAIADALGAALLASHAVSGGCIHHSRCLDLADGRRVFVKSADGSGARMLVAEEMGLRLLSPHIRTPVIVGSGEAKGSRWLALEWLDLAPMRPAAWEDLGRQMARLHEARSTCHGLDHDNFIGATPQENRPLACWSAFFLERRLQPQLALARRLRIALPEDDILAAASRLLDGHDPTPSLLHGDLWSGNTAAITGDRAVVFDPAPYFGDAETDLAMLELFGGPLPEAFRKGYGILPSGRESRRPLYDLYHALNHLNLFGTGYAGMVARCVEEIGRPFR